MLTALQKYHVPRREIKQKNEKVLLANSGQKEIKSGANES